MTDRELLAGYAATASPGAFAQIVERYGGTVYAACRRALGDAHAAEDAAQAVFLVLVRRARSLPHSTLLAGWLFRTAGHVCRDARKLAERRARHERKAAAMERAAGAATEARGLPAEARAHLNAALESLAEPTRSAVILRYLRGRSEPEIGRELGCGQSTVAMRIARGLERLRRELAARGVTVPAAALGGMLAGEAAAAAPAALLATLKGLGAGASAASASAAVLAEGIVKTMVIVKLKLAAAVIVSVLAVGGGAGALAVKLAAAESKPPEPGPPHPERVEVKLPHKGDVVGEGGHKGDIFGEGGEWDKQYAREALQIFRDLKPDPAWVAKLKDLPDNTWMPCPINGDQWRGAKRGEVPIEYVPEVRGCFVACGCGVPGYSSDSWLYHTGANRWVQMWPNHVKSDAGARLNRMASYPTDRPWTRCSLGLAYDTDRKRLVLRGGANSGPTSGRITWEYDPTSNRWERTAPHTAGFQRYEDNCVGFAPGFGVVEIGGDRHSKTPAATWVYRPGGKWESVKTQGSPPGANNCRPVWASGPRKLMYLARGQLWAFDPQTLVWADLTPADGTKPSARERAGIAYDSRNDVLIMNGGSDGTDKRPADLWAFSFKTGRWTEMKPPLLGEKGDQPPPNSWGALCYDREHNVFVSGHPWVYRYKRADQGDSSR